MTRVLLITADIPAAAAICAGLHGEHLTACDTAEMALREMTSAESFDVILCDASLAILEIVVRAARQVPHARVAFLATNTSDHKLAGTLCGGEAALVNPVDDERLRAFVQGH